MKKIKYLIKFKIKNIILIKKNNKFNNNMKKKFEKFKIKQIKLCFLNKINFNNQYKINKKMIKSYNKATINIYFRVKLLMK